MTAGPRTAISLRKLRSRGGSGKSELSKGVPRPGSTADTFGSGLIAVSFLRVSPGGSVSRPKLRPGRVKRSRRTGGSPSLCVSPPFPARPFGRTLRNGRGFDYTTESRRCLVPHPHNNRRQFSYALRMHSERRPRDAHRRHGLATCV